MVKHFTLLSLLAALCFQAPAWAALSEADKAVFPFQNRILSNPGFELSKSGWAVSGGTFTVQSAVKDAGNAAGLWTPGASGQTLTSALVAVPDGLRGRNGVVSCAFRTGSGSTAHTLTADDGTNNLAAPQAITPSQTSFQRKSVNLIFPTTGSVRLKLTAASTDQVYIDSCYFDLAEGFNLMQVSQASLYGAVTISGCSGNWTTTSGTFASFGAVSGCSYASFANASAPSTNLPALKFASLPEGNYFIVLSGRPYVAGTGNAGFFEFYDGSNSTSPLWIYNSTNPNTSGGPGMTAFLPVTSARSNVTLELRGKADAGSTVGLGGSGGTTTIHVYRFPLTSELAYRPEQGPRTATVTFPSAASCNPLVTAAGWTDMASANCSGASFTGGASAVGVSNGIGMRIGTVKQGSYLAIGMGELYAGSPSGTICRFRLSDGTNFTPMVQTEAGGTTDRLSSVAGILTYASDQSNVDLRLQAFRSTGTGSCGMWAGDSGNKFQIALIPLDSLLSSPLLVGSVTSKYSGPGDHEWAYITWSGSAYSVGVGSWWISGVTRNGAGDVTLAFLPGVFAGTPICIGNGIGSLYVSNSYASNSATSVNVQIRNGTSAGAQVDNSFQIMCSGPR